MATIVSPASAAAAGTLIPVRGWLTDPLDNTVAVPLRRLHDISSSVVSATISFTDSDTEEMGIFYPFGRENAVIQRGTVIAGSFNLNFILIGHAERDALDQLRRSGHTLLVRADTGDCWYVVLGPTVTRGTLRDGARVTNPYTVITAPCTITDPPA